MMKEVKKLVMGPVSTNTYILREKGHCILFDPAANPKRILEAIHGDHVDAICLTHGHFDHIQAVDALVKQLHCDVYISEDDEELLRDSKKNASIMLNPFTVRCSVKHYQRVTRIGQFEFQVMEAGGHTRGSVILMIDELMFCGDVLFKDGIGRCDLYGGSFSQMKATLKKIAKISKDYKVFCGHGEDTTLFEEFKNNPYFND